MNDHANEAHKNVLDMDDGWFLKHCAQVLMDNGYAVIHKDRLVNVGQQSNVSDKLLNTMHDDMKAPYLHRVEQDAALSFGAYMLRQGLLARAPDFGKPDNLGNYVFRWGACVVLPRTTDAA